jgi:hypothetical protein
LSFALVKASQSSAASFSGRTRHLSIDSIGDIFWGHHTFMSGATYNKNKAICGKCFAPAQTKDKE